MIFARSDSASRSTGVQLEVAIARRIVWELARDAGLEFLALIILFGGAWVAGVWLPDLLPWSAVAAFAPLLCGYVIFRACRARPG